MRTRSTKSGFVGKGIINSVVDKLPFELHIPGGYQFCGPSTKLGERLARGERGINKLDSACRSHDVAYSLTRDLATRHKADRILLDRAWERAKSDDADLKERSAAYLVSGAMKAKLALGAGMKKKKIESKRKKRVGKGMKKGKKGVSKRKTIRKMFAGPRVIPLPKQGGILNYLNPILTGLKTVGNVAHGANNFLKCLQEMKGKGLQQKAKLAPFKRGWGLYLKPYNPKNC